MSFVGSKKSGFTLIELLVVISIIGVLSSIILVRLNDVRKKTRNTVRRADLVNIKKALEAYYIFNNGQYPSESTCDSSKGSCAACPCAGSDWTYSNPYIAQVLRTAGYFQNMPKDPINDATYYYWYEPDCEQGVCVGRGCCKYSIGAPLEGGGSFVLSSDGN